MPGAACEHFFTNLLCHLPSSHHFIATLFNKLIKSGSAPACWGRARIKLIYKSGDNSDPSNFRPIALTSVVGKLLYKILSRRLEEYLKSNDVIDTSVQKGFLLGSQGSLNTFMLCLQLCKMLSQINILL